MQMKCGRATPVFVLLAALVVSASAAAATPTEPNGEVDVMLALRQAVHGTFLKWVDNDLGAGWSLGDPTPHCLWYHVRCDNLSRVITILIRLHSGKPRINDALDERASLPVMLFGPKAPLLPELARLEWLETLEFKLALHPLPSGIPPEWLTPGAFPRLKNLLIEAGHLPDPLPDIPPGALPLLTNMAIGINSLHTTLPASWGQPGVLPKLRQLRLDMQFQGGLPPDWAQGFHQLENLDIFRIPFSNSGGACAVLPASWAAGFPKLRHLSLKGIDINGSIPTSWLEGGFPSLTSLGISYSNLAGPLPAQLLERQPAIQELGFFHNLFTGTLPEIWAASKVIYLDLSGNQLSGNAFPDAWVAPGAFSNLRQLNMKINPGLSGTLPAALSWPALVSLDFEDTGLTGTIPAAWCHSPFRLTLQSIWLRETELDPNLPACAANDMPNVRVNRIGGQFYQPRDHNQHYAAWLSASLLLLAAMAALAAATGMGIWQKCRQLRPNGAPAVLEHLPPQEEAGRLDQHGLAKGSARGSSTSGQHGMHHGRKARLAELLKAHVGGQPEWQLDTLRMLPVETLPEALAHHVGAASSIAGPSPKAGLRRGLTNPSNAELERQRSSSGRELTPLLTPSRGGAQVEMSLANCAQWQGNNNSGAGRDRQWGLDTASLLVTAGDLLFTTSVDGHLVDLGAGSEGAVFLARLQGQEVAVKVYEILPGMESQARWKEAQLLHSCAHPHIVPLLGVALKGPLLMLAMEWMRGGSLWLALQKPGTRTRLAWNQRGCKVAADVADALAYMHGTLHIMHSDLKSNNVLLSSDLRGHIADLGLAQLVGSAGLTAAGGTRKYAAPEQLMGHKCTLAADIYSLGIVLVELTTQEMGGSRGEWRLPSAPHECPEEVVSLISDCIQTDPLKRPSAEQVLHRLRAAAVCCRDAPSVE